MNNQKLRDALQTLLQASLSPILPTEFTKAVKQAEQALADPLLNTQFKGLDRNDYNLIFDTIPDQQKIIPGNLNLFDNIIRETERRMLLKNQEATQDK